MSSCSQALLKREKRRSRRKGTKPKERNRNEAMAAGRRRGRRSTEKNGRDLDDGQHGHRRRQSGVASSTKGLKEGEGGGQHWDIEGGLILNPT